MTGLVVAFVILFAVIVVGDVLFNPDDWKRR